MPPRAVFVILLLLLLFFQLIPVASQLPGGQRRDHQRVPVLLARGTRRARQLRPVNLHKKNIGHANVQHGALEKGRLFPRVKPYRLGSAAGADDIAEDNLAMEELEKDTFSASSRTRETRANWWTLRAKARGIKPFPLDAQKLRLLGALLKKGDIGVVRRISQMPNVPTLKVITRGVDNWHWSTKTLQEP